MLLRKSPVFFLLAFFTVYAKAQPRVLPDDPALFGDSVNTLLSATRQGSAMEIGDEFAAIWPKLSPDQQNQVIPQMQAIEEKGLRMIPFQKAYCVALANAIHTDSAGADPQKITEYLRTTEKVIDTSEPKPLLRYLRFAASFFRHKALYFERSNKLYVANADYRFEFIEPEIADDGYAEDQEYPEPLEDDADWDSGWDDYENQEFDDDYYYDSAYNESETEYAEDYPAVVLPLLEGPILRFDAADLNFVTRYDSVFLQNTKGSYSILSQEFVGHGGRFDWSMAGLSADSVYAEFGDYVFTGTYPRFRADGAQLTYTGKLAAPVEGIFEYKSVRHDTTTDSRYPTFMSYQNNIRMTDLGKDLIYEGGFTLHGPKISSTSASGGDSRIFVLDSMRLKFKAKATLFEFRDSVITTQKSSIVIIQGIDSIRHPVVRLQYNFKNKFLTVQKDKGGYKDTPFSSSFYHLDFTADIIKWAVQSDSMNISILEARNIVPAYFESSNHYNYDDYRSLGDRVYPFNPLSLVMFYSNKYRLNDFYVDDLAGHFKRDRNVISGAMTGLAEKGLIGFDRSAGKISVTQKSRHLYNAKLGFKDYDNIILKSVISEGPNAILDFSTNELTVRGVESFKISDSLNVVIEPDSSEIKFLKNRDFIFNGKVFAGNFEYLGKDFIFKYDSFLIHLNTIDSIQFFVKQENSRISKGPGSQGKGMASNNLQNTSGTLYINKPRNKSAKLKFANYPRFSSTKGGEVYFNRDQVLDGAYDQSVYFSIPSLDLDSLDGADASNITLKGSFVSSGIFPEFEEKMSMQKDLSLGFEHDVPPEGYRLYKGEGRFYNKLTLNQGGIRGNGRIDFLTTTMESDDFIFYPDSVTGAGEKFEIRRETYNGVTFPAVNVEKYQVEWLPKKDSMYVHNIGNPFQFYDNTASLDGTAIVSNSGVSGSGRLETRGSALNSNAISLRPDSFVARNAQFELQSDDPKKPALYGDDVKVDFNLSEDYAVISPEVEGEAAIEFPYSQFKTSITEARWDLEKKKITMSKPDGVALENSYFYTTRKELDSLSFMATDAEYDINTSELKVSGIPYIIVADAKITPQNNEVLILENAKIGQLTNTTIILDTLNGYHRLTDGVIDIKSRNAFSGYATYQFVDSRMDTIPIKMENFRSEKLAIPSARKKDIRYTTHTVANSFIDEAVNLLISPAMYFKGEVTLYAHKPAMELGGYVKPDLKNAEYNAWIKHSSSADQREVFIDFENALTEGGKRLESGLYMASADNSLYGFFISGDFNTEDDRFFIPKGHLFFDKFAKEFVIADTAKANGHKFSGQVFRYNDATSNVRFEGRANFTEPTDDVQVLTTVIGTGSLNDLSFEMNAMMSLNFGTVPSQVFDIMANDFLDIIKFLGLPDGQGDPTQLLYKLGDLSGEQAATSYEERSLKEYVPVAGFTKETSRQLTFADLNIKWSGEHRAFYSDGKLGMAGIHRTDLNGAFDGFMEIKKTPEGFDVFNLFIKAAPDSWYFLSYEDSRLLLFSSNEAFNELVDKKSNSAKAKVGELVFVPADEEETRAFINRFRLQYYGIDDEYELSSETEEVAIEEVEEVEESDFGTADNPDDEFEEDDDGF